MTDTGQTAPAPASGDVMVPRGWFPEWRHKKRGTDYRIIGNGTVASDLIGEGRQVVYYQGKDGRCWVREFYEFYDGRFEKLPEQPSAPRPSTTPSIYGYCYNCEAVYPFDPANPTQHSCWSSAPRPSGDVAATLERLRSWHRNCLQAQSGQELHPASWGVLANVLEEAIAAFTPLTERIATLEQERTARDAECERYKWAIAVASRYLQRIDGQMRGPCSQTAREGLAQTSRALGDQR